MTTLMNLSKSKIVALAAGLWALGAACTPEGQPDPGSDPNTPGELPSSSGENTFDHPAILEVDPFELLARMQRNGPPEFQARLHSCMKMRYTTLGNVLRSRGVNTANTTTTSAGNMWRTSGASLGTPNYIQRVAEATEVSAAVASKMFDIWVAAAPEIVTAMPTAPACQVGGAGTQFFDSAGSCTLAGIECVSGMPATQTHVDLCNQIVAGASTVAIGRQIAVGAVASAAHTCE
jgi:hypothetical protein